MDATNQVNQPLCPSARSEMEGAVIFGVVDGTAQEPRATQEQDEVSGYLLNSPSAGPITIGRTFPPTRGPKPIPGPIMPMPPVVERVE